MGRVLWEEAGKGWAGEALGLAAAAYKGGMHIGVVWDPFLMAWLHRDLRTRWPT